MLKITKKNKIYWVTSAAFVIWITFFDSADLISQYRLFVKIRKKKSEQTYYKEQIAALKKAKEALNDPKKLEKIAREKHFMKKPGETIYIIEEK